jgi:hypothetical protein
MNRELWSVVGVMSSVLYAVAVCHAGKEINMKPCPYDNPELPAEHNCSKPDTLLGANMITCRNCYQFKIFVKERKST